MHLRQIKELATALTAWTVSQTIDVIIYHVATFNPLAPGYDNDS